MVVMQGNPGFRNLQVPKQEQEPSDGSVEGEGKGTTGLGSGRATLAAIKVRGTKGTPTTTRAIQKLAQLRRR